MYGQKGVTIVSTQQERGTPEANTAHSGKKTMGIAGSEERERSGGEHRYRLGVKKRPDGRKVKSRKSSSIVMNALTSLGKRPGIFQFFREGRDDNFYIEKRNKK